MPDTFDTPTDPSDVPTAADSTVDGRTVRSAQEVVNDTSDAQTPEEALEAAQRAAIDPKFATVPAEQAEVTNIPGVDPLGYGNSTRLRAPEEKAGDSSVVTDHGQPTASDGVEVVAAEEGPAKVVNEDIVTADEAAENLVERESAPAEAEVVAADHDDTPVE